MVLALTLALAMFPPAMIPMRVPNGGIQPQVLQDAKGTVHLVYYKGDPMHGDLYYTQSADEGMTWTDPKQVNHKPHDAIARGAIRGAQIAFGPDGTLHVVWLGSDSGPNGMPLYYTRKPVEADEFEAERNLQGHTVDMDGGATIAADADNDVYVLWHAPEHEKSTEADRKLWIAKSTDSGKTFAAEKPAWDEPTGACACCSVKAQVIGKSLYVIYRSAQQTVHRDPYLLVSNDNGSTFTGKKIGAWEIGGCPMTNSFFSSSSKGVTVAFEEKAKPVLHAPGFEFIAPDNGKYPVADSQESGTVFSYTKGASFAQAGTAVVTYLDGSGKVVESKNLGEVPLSSFTALFRKRNGGYVVLF